VWRKEHSTTSAVDWAAKRLPRSALLCLCSAQRPVPILTPPPRWRRPARRTSTHLLSAGRRPRRMGPQLSTIPNTSRIQAPSPLAVLMESRFRTSPNAVPERVRRVARGRTDARERSVIANPNGLSRSRAARPPRSARDSPYFRPPNVGDKSQ